MIRRTGGEVVPLNRNFRSTPEICAAVSQTFGPGGDLEMTDDGFQVEFRDMVAVSDSVPDAIYHHVIPCYEDGNLPGDDEETAMLLDPHWEAAEQVALYIRDRVDNGGKEFGDFLVIGFNKEKHDQYSEVFRRFRIPVKYDGVLPMTAYHPLQLPAEKVLLEDIRAWLAEKIAEKLSFMTDGTSSFRKGLEKAEVHAEIPFVISVSPADGQVYYSLAGLMNITGGRRAEVHGKIDLALRYPDGSWVIADYKTDRMLPEDEGNRERFENRLRREYGNQLQIYRVVLEYLTGEKVRETKLISV